MCFLLGNDPSATHQNARTTVVFRGLQRGDGQRRCRQIWSESCEPDTVTDTLPTRRKKWQSFLRLATCRGDNSCRGSICLDRAALTATTMSRLIMWHICQLFAMKLELLTNHCGCVRWFNTIQQSGDKRKMLQPAFVNSCTAKQI